MFDPMTLLIIFATFLLAGTVKGVIGLGLPTVSLALLTLAFDLPGAMALLLVPSFVTNLWQALNGGNTLIVARRLWPFLVMATVMVWLGAMALTRVDLDYLSALLGALLVVYAGLSLTGRQLTIQPAREVWAGPLFGIANGVLTGMTGSFVVPGVMFLQAIGLPRDSLIQAMGMLFTVSTVALALALGNNDLLSTDQGLMSASGVLPAIIGMALGQQVRRHLSESVFRRVFFIALLLLGGYIMAQALGVFA
ncbi:MAG: sulfite exporter TauE/SafE family protein [Rhodospirillales bacterium]